MIEKSDYWSKYEEIIGEMIDQYGMDDFLQWKAIQDNMFVYNAKYLQTEIDYLSGMNKQHYCFHETDVGKPIRRDGIPMSDNFIHQAYHLARGEEALGIVVKDLDYIFEFGGGYGCLCYLIHQLGFKGTYVLQDLPVYSRLQEYYLSHSGINIEEVDIIFRTGPDEAPANPRGKSLFLSCWALSECPLPYRELYHDVIKECKFALFAYQEKFETVSNYDYFVNLRVSIDRSKLWQNVPIEHLPGNFYLFGGEF